MSNLSRGIVTK